MYRIRSIRCRGYYFTRSCVATTIMYSRAVFNINPKRNDHAWIPLKWKKPFRGYRRRGKQKALKLVWQTACRKSRTLSKQRESLLQGMQFTLSNLAHFLLWYSCSLDPSMCVQATPLLHCTVWLQVILPHSQCLYHIRSIRRRSRIEAAPPDALASRVARACTWIHLVRTQRHTVNMHRVVAFMNKQSSTTS